MNDRFLITVCLFALILASAAWAEPGDDFDNRDAMLAELYPGEVLDPHGNPDGDRYNTWQELAFGTDPLAYNEQLIEIDGSGSVKWPQIDSPRRVGINILIWAFSNEWREYIGEIAYISETGWASILANERTLYQLRPIQLSNTRPTIEDLVIETAEDTPKTITLSATDEDESILAYKVLSSSKTTNTLTGDQLTITPLPNENGGETIELQVSDEYSTAYFNIQLGITSVNDDPVVSIINSLVADEDAGFVKDFSTYVNDPDGDSLSITATVDKGNVSGNGELTFNFPENYNGIVNGVLSANDGTTTVTKPFSITVDQVNDEPTIGPYSNVNLTDRSVVIPKLGNDVDGDELNYSVNEPGWNVVDNGSDLTLNAPEGFTGTESLEIITSDGNKNATSNPFTATQEAIGPTNVDVRIVYHNGGTGEALTEGEFQAIFTPIAGGEDYVFTSTNGIVTGNIPIGDYQADFDWDGSLDSIWARDYSIVNGDAGHEQKAGPDQDITLTISETGGDGTVDMVVDKFDITMPIYKLGLAASPTVRFPYGTIPVVINTDYDNLSPESRSQLEYSLAELKELEPQYNFIIQETSTMPSEPHIEIQRGSFGSSTNATWSDVNGITKVLLRVNTEYVGTLPHELGEGIVDSKDDAGLVTGDIIEGVYTYAPSTKEAFLEPYLIPTITHSTSQKERN